jgi:serine/threonine protein kinase
MLSFIKDITGIGNDQTHIIENNEKPGENQNEKNEPNNNANNNDQTKTTLLNQGTYGCVFRPGIECSSKQLTSKKYITKIQKYKETSIREVEMGKKIKKIPGYSQYFAPIIESCDVTVGALNNDPEAKKCDFINMGPEYQNKKYESNRIRYVGKNTLGDYLVKEAANVSQLENYFRKLINTHTTLLKGITKLNAANIMHFDMKENNVICKDKSGRPIIIDFGLSVDTTNIASPEEFPAADAFFAYGVSYAPWCLDIGMITYMIHKTKNANVEQPTPNAWRKENATLEETNKVIGEFIKTNPTMMELFTPEMLEEYKKKAEAYYAPLVEGGMLNVPSWGNVYDELIKYHKSWDNYGVAVMILDMLRIMELHEEASNNFPFMKQYIELLTNIVLSMPDKRPTAEETATEIKTVMSKLLRKDKAKIRKVLTPWARTNHGSQQLAKSRIATVKTDEEFVARKQKIMQRVKAKYAAKQ